MAIHIDVVPDLNRRAVRDSARDMQRDLQRAGMDAGKSFGTQFGAGFEKSSPKIEKGLNKVADATGKVRVEQERLNNMQKQGAASSDRLVAQHERLAKARRDEASAVRRLASEMRSLDGGSSSLSGISRAGTEATGSLSQMGAVVGSLGRVAGPAGLGVLAGSIGAVAGVAAAASGVIGSLPGVLGGAAAAFGTLKIATLGFGEAMENLRDTEKFNEALRSLSPNAREAAMSIRSLMPAFDELKNATQDALFANVGPQLQRMSAQLMPALQQMTTGISGAFNTMFMGITDQLMTPEMTSVIGNITGNITTAFQNLAPAATSMTNAFAQLTSVGSDFLPGLATAAADAAASFSRFITEAANSGQLEQWISTGMSMMKQLGAATLNVAEAFIAMAPVGERIMPAIVNATEVLVDLMPVLNSLIVPISPLLTGWAPAIDGASTAVGGLIGAMSPLLTTVNAIADAWAYIRGDKGPRGGRELRAPGAGGGVAGAPGFPGLPGGLGRGGLGGGAGMPQGIGSIGGRGIGDISQWSGNPINNGRGGVGGASGGSASGPVVPYTGDPMSLLQGMPVNAQLYGAASTVLDSQHRLEQSKAELNALMQSNDATAEQIQDKRNDVAIAERESHEAELRLIEAKQSATEKFTNTMGDAAGSLGEIGAALDADLGISKGLPGLADNLVRFLGSLAMAPVVGALAGVQKANGYEPGSAGKGLFGVMAAGGAFGSQYQMMPGMGQAGPSGGYSGGYTGGYAGDAALLANVPAGRYTQELRGDLTQGLADCSSAVEDLVNMLEGRSTAGASMYTGNAAEFLQSRGFMPGMGGPGDMRVGYNSGHMQATLPGGTNFNWGSNASAANRGIGGTGAYDPSFTDHWYRPQGGGMSPAGIVGGFSASPSAASPYDANNPTGGGNFNPNMRIDTSQASVAPPYNPNQVTPWALGQNMVGDNGLAPGEGRPGQGPLAAMSPTAPGGPQTGMGSQAYSNPVGGEGFAGLGGLPMAAIQGAISAGGGAGSMFGGQAAAAAAQVGMELANRAVAFGGQAASIGVSGLMETFLPSGDSADASIGNSWLGRIAGGLAGARPATPNLAGQAPTAEQKAQGQQSGQPQTQQGATPTGEQVGVKIENYNVTKSEDRAGQDLARHQTAGMQAGQGIR